MADGYSHIPVDLDALQNDRNTSQTTIYLPSPPSLKSVSTYYPKKDLDVLEDNLDPFYLEQSLPAAIPWDSTTPGVRHDRFDEHASQHFMTPSVDTCNEISPGSAYKDYMTAQYNRPTLELDHELCQQHGIHHLEHTRFHSKESFSSSRRQSTPGLSPSSSFSSNYSASIYPDPAIRATEQLFLHVKETKFSEADQFSLHPCTPPGRYKAASQPFSAAASTEPKSRASQPLETTMYDRKNGYSHRGKPLPSLPNLANSNKHTGKKGIDSPRRPLEPSMISPPSLLDPITLEPHTSHFDRAFFIPATDFPSPVPSPTLPSPPFLRDVDAYCERSVWESDSDDESIGHKSLSRRPIDTLRKVRSRAKLRVAKSTTKLRQEDQNLEHFPSIPNNFQEHYRSSMSTPLDSHPSRDVFRPSAHETMRLVAPSATSLPRPPSRMESLQGYDVDRSTAAALQAKSRRRRSPETERSSDRTRLTTLCRNECSSSSIRSMTLSRTPFFRRVWRSLQLLSCRTDMAPKNPGRSF